CVARSTRCKISITNYTDCRRCAMDNVHIMSAPEIGAMLGITARRVRQYVDDGLLPTIERGRFDMVFLMYLRSGEQRTRNASKRPGRDTLVALGWLPGVGDTPTNEDLTAFAQIFARNGLTRDAAFMAVGRAMEAK